MEAMEQEYMGSSYCDFFNSVVRYNLRKTLNKIPYAIPIPGWISPANPIVLPEKTEIPHLSNLYFIV